MWLKLYGYANPVAQPFSFKHIPPIIVQDADNPEQKTAECV